MTLGNLAAFLQDDVRRLLAYSTITQVGYLLMAVTAANRAELALPALGLYLAAYVVTNLGAFAVVEASPRTRTPVDYRVHGHRHRWLAFSLVVCLLGLIGTSLTAAFVGKLTEFTAAVDADLAWLAVIAVLNTMASVFYYLRWIAPVFRNSNDDRIAAVPAPAATGPAHDVIALTGTWAAISAHPAAPRSSTDDTAAEHQHIVGPADSVDAA